MEENKENSLQQNNSEREKKNFFQKIKDGYEVFLKVLKKFFGKYEFLFAVIVITVLATVLRAFLFDFKSGDYNSFLVHWFATIKEEGFFKSMSHKIGDYTPSYFYVLSFLTLFPVDSLYSIKVVSCVFDVLMAFSVMLIVQMNSKSKFAPIVIYAVVLLLPTVFINSAVWAQCDSIFTAFCVLSIYFLMCEKNITAVIMYAIAFTFKLQAIFLAPLFAVLFFKRKIQLYSPLIVLLIYFITCIPPWLCGRSLGELLTIYINQAQEYTSLSLNAPTLVVLFGNIGTNFSYAVSNALIVITALVVLLAVYIFARKVKINNEAIVDISMFFALIIPFLLPRMHERYFYLADILSIIYCFMHKKRLYTAILTVFCSMYVVCRYIFSLNFTSLQVIALVELINIILLVRDIAKDYIAKAKEQESEAKTALPFETTEI